MSQRWIVFDYGEVISLRTEAVPAMAELVGVPLADFEPGYWSERRAYDAGLDDLPYWTAVCAHVGVEVDDRLSKELTELDINGWLHTDPAAVELIGRLAGMGARLALLSNAPSSFGRVAERQPWTRHFEHTVFSGDLGMIKPDAEIFAALVGKLGARAVDCVFVDNMQANVDGAVAAGLHAHLWTSAADLSEPLIRFANGS